jgi:hypothetical protein
LYPIMPTSAPNSSRREYENHEIRPRTVSNTSVHGTRGSLARRCRGCRTRKSLAFVPIPPRNPTTCRNLTEVSTRRDIAVPSRSRHLALPIMSMNASAAFVAGTPLPGHIIPSQKYKCSSTKKALRPNNTSGAIGTSPSSFARPAHAWFVGGQPMKIIQRRRGWASIRA